MSLKSFPGLPHADWWNGFFRQFERTLLVSPEWTNERQGCLPGSIKLKLLCQLKTIPLSLSLLHAHSLKPYHCHSCFFLSILLALSPLLPFNLAHFTVQHHTLISAHIHFPIFSLTQSGSHSPSHSQAQIIFLLPRPFILKVSIPLSFAFSLSPSDSAVPVYNLAVWDRVQRAGLHCSCHSSKSRHPQGVGWDPSQWTGHQQETLISTITTHIGPASNAN